ncbi:MAG TPA: TolC family protein [Terriglobales bacterium]|nr:TolC family protein [Terriglobales bacterium]
MALHAQTPAAAPPAQAPAVQVDLEQAMQLALTHSPALAAARTQIPQSQAQEVTAAIRPNPILSWDALFLPVFNPKSITLNYLNTTAEYDASVGFTIERGHKRQARVEAARDATAVVRAQVDDNVRTLRFNVAQQFIGALLDKSSLEFAQQDLASWRNTTSISQAQYNAGAMSEGDLDTIKLQTLQFENTVSADTLGLAQALIALRQQVGLSALPANFDVSGDLTFEAVHGNADDFKMLALKNRPDLNAARLAVTAAESQHKLAQANGKRNLTTTIEYSHVGALNDVGTLFSIEIPIFDRNQGEIARTVAATTQAQDQARQANEQVLTDVATAFEAAQEGAKIIQLYTSGYRDQAKQALDIRQYSYSRGASSLLDLLDAERTYRSTELGYRQALATYMLALEQLKEAVGTRNLP